MTQLYSIAQLKSRHDELYSQAISGDPDPDPALLESVEKLLEQLKSCSKQVTTVDDYRWIRSAALQWQLMFSSTWSIPKTIEISIAPRNLLENLPSDAALSKTELENWRRKNAEYLGLLRVAREGRDSCAAERDWDWHQAQILLVSDILDGFPSFAGRVAAESYWRLEEIWLKEVKRVRAYFIWLREGGGLDAAREKVNYDKACEHIRMMLVNEAIKARATEFGEAKAYLEGRYLTDGRIVHEGKDERNIGARRLIQRKAERIGERRKKWELHYRDDAKNHLENWVHAETYVKMFYESIIPAVMDSDAEKVLTVLKAFQYSKAPENCWWVINCLETALAIYFLNASTIKKLWAESAKEPAPTSSIETVVAVKFWPQGIEVPAECRDSFDFDRNKITFKGVMTEAQRKTLMGRFTDETARQNLEKLFLLSRLIHRETTL